MANAHFGASKEWSTSLMWRPMSQLAKTLPLPLLLRLQLLRKNYSQRATWTRSRARLYSHPILFGLLSSTTCGKHTKHLCPFVSGCSGPTANLSTFLDFFVKGKLREVPAHIKDTDDFVCDLTQLPPLPEDTILVTADVKSLYTMIPQDEGIEALLKCSDFLPFPPHLTKTALSLVLKKNVFRFNKQMYHQKTGVAMGSPISPTLAIVFMDSLETPFQASRPLKPLLYPEIAIQGEGIHKQFSLTEVLFVPPDTRTERVEPPHASRTFFLKAFIDNRRPSIKPLLVAHWSDLCDDARTKQVFEHAEVYMCLKNVTNNQRLITRVARVASWCGRTGCLTCPIFEERNCIISAATRERFPIATRMTCSSHLIYVIRCVVCGMQYVRETVKPLHLRVNNHREKFRSALGSPDGTAFIATLICMVGLDLCELLRTLLVTQRIMRTNGRRRRKLFLSSKRISLMGSIRSSIGALACQCE
eukprot:Em0018g1143a